MRQRATHHLPVERDCRLLAGAVRAPPARRGFHIVQLEAQELHQALVGRRVVAHRLLLETARGGHGRDAFLVVGPLLGRAPPLAAVAGDRAVDLEHLQHRLQAALAHVHLRQDLAHGNGRA